MLDPYGRSVIETNLRLIRLARIRIMCTDTQIDCGVSIINLTEERDVAKIANDSMTQSNHDSNNKERAEFILSLFFRNCH